ncbi:hypothetical protein [Nonomuraea dietziae]
MRRPYRRLSQGDACRGPSGALREELGMSEAQLDQLARNSFEAAFAF